MCKNVPEVCRVSYLKTFSEKNPGKITGKNFRELQQHPSGCKRVEEGILSTAPTREQYSICGKTRGGSAKYF